MNYKSRSWAQFVLGAFVLLFPKLSEAQYCRPSTQNATCNQTITSVQVGDYVENPSFDCAANQGYFYFDTDTLYAIPDAVNDVIVKEVGGLISNVQVFVDLNSDGAFTPDESTSLARQPNSNTHTGSFIAAGVAGDTCRMRVMLLTDYSPDGCGPTTGTVYQTVDYNLIITTDLPTPPPSAGPTYCSATGNAGCDGDAISNVTLTGDDGSEINNNTGCDAYGDYTHLKATVTGGDVYIATVEAGPNLAGVCSIFVDWNNDGDFDDPDETFPSAANGQPHTITIATPANSTSGLKRMRVRSTFLANTPEDCGVQPGGEVEDYTLLYLNPINPSPNCVSTTTPDDQFQGICTNTTLSWNSVADVTTYELFVEDRSTGTVAAQLSLVDTTYNISGLSVSTEYHWIVVPNADGTKAVACDTLVFYTNSDATPTFTLTPSADTSVTCEGIATVYDATATGGTGVISYAWNSNNNTFFDDTALASPTFTANTSGIYTISVSVEDEVGCGSSDTVHLDVQEGFDISIFMNAEITDSIEVCLGAETMFDTNIDGGNGTETYNWTTTDNATIEDPDGVGTPVIPLEVGVMKFLLTVTNDKGCLFEKEITLNVVDSPDKPIIQAFNNPFCEGDSALLVVTNYTSGLIWNNGVTNDSTAAYTSGEYVVVYEKDPYCRVSSDEVTITKVANPSAPVLSQLNDSVCAGIEAILFADAQAGETVIWSEGTQNDTLMTSTPGTYTAYVVSSEGCVGPSSSITFEQDAGPVLPSISVSGDDCEGGEKVLTSSAEMYNVWNTAEETQSIVAVTAGEYFLNVVWPNGCTSDTAKVSVTFNPTPNKPVVRQEGESITTDSTQGDMFTWTDGDGNVVYQGENATYTPDKTDDYFVQVTNSSGCESEVSDSFSFTHTSIKNRAYLEATVYPNPVVNGVVNVELNELDNVQFSLVDLTGKVVFSTDLQSSKVSLPNDLESGMYIYRLTSDMKQKTGHLQIK